MKNLKDVCHDNKVMAMQLNVAIDALMFYATQYNSTQQLKVKSDRGLIARNAVAKMMQILSTEIKNEEDNVGANSDNGMCSGGAKKATRRKKAKSKS